LFAGEFTSNSSSQSLSGNFKWIEMDKIVVVGNFDVVSQTGTVTFPSTGIWTDYLDSSTKNISSVDQSFTLAPGEFHIFLKSDTTSNPTFDVSVTEFTGSKSGHENVLNWKVNDEKGLDHFEVQKSENGNDYSTIATFDPNGNKSYNYTDGTSSDGSSVYYRIKIVGPDGVSSYSNIVTLENQSFVWKVGVYPNPAGTYFTVNIASPQNDKATILITDLQGRKMYKKQYTLIGGDNHLPITQSAAFANGTYVISVFSSHKTETIKAIKNK
jgi:hypothetical protein